MVHRPDLGRVDDGQPPMRRADLERMAAIRQAAQTAVAAARDTQMAGTNTLSKRSFLDRSDYEKVVSRDAVGRLRVDWSIIGEGDER